jgi:hypothetical protein
MRRPDPLATLFRAAVLLAIGVGIVFAALYVPYETCRYEAVFDAGEVLELCSDARGWVWELPEIAEVYDRDYAAQIAIAVGAAFAFFLLNAAIRRAL